MFSHRVSGQGGDRVLSAQVVVTASFGAIGLSTVLAQEDRLLRAWQLSATAFLMILITHQTGEMS